MVNVSEVMKLNDNFGSYSDVKSLLLKGTVSERKPMVSILIPTYNRVDTLEQTLNSCLSQVGFEDYNIIVCDNNPERDDATEKFMATVDSPLVKYYKNEKNITMFGNLNRLITLSEGEYSVIIHDDDMLFPHFLKIAFDCMQRNPRIDILYPAMNKWDVSVSSTPPSEKLSNKSFIRKLTLEDFVAGTIYPPTGVFFKTKSIISIGGFDYDTWPSTDYYFNVRAVRQLNVYVLSLPLFIYRWGINESLKKETQLNFMRVDVPLQKWICEQLPMFRHLKYMIYLNYSLCRKSVLESTFGKEAAKEAEGLIKTNITIADKILWRCFHRFFNLYNKIRIKRNSVVYIIQE